MAKCRLSMAIGNKGDMNIKERIIEAMGMSSYNNVACLTEVK